jgi:hypothetical protein
MMKGKSIDDIEQVANEFAEIKGISVDEAYDRATAWHAMNEGKGFDAVISQAQEMVDMPIFSAHDKYERLAGEAEARNVQTRMDYTPEQRQAAAPWTTLDVPESELIVRGNSNGPMMSVSKAQAIEELEKRGIPMGEALRGKYVDVGRLSDELELATSQLNQRRLNLPDGHILIKSGEKRVAKAQKALTKGAEQQGKFAAWFGDSKASSNGSPKTLYHGSTKDINDFRRGRDNRAFWAAEDTNVANSYAGDREGAVIYPLNMKMENPLVHDAESASWMDLTYNGERLSTDDLADIAQEAGHDGLIIKNIRDMDTDDGGDVPSDHYAVFDSANIRSPNAAFNPKDIGKSGLLKSVGGVGLGYQFLSGEDEQNQF